MGRVGLVDCLTFENDISEPLQYTRLYYFDSIFYPAQLVRLDRWVISADRIGGSDRWIGSVDRQSEWIGSDRQKHGSGQP